MRSRAAFTLLELLTVIAIVALLIALLVPAVQAAREAVRKTSCQNNLKQIGLALHNYHNTHQTLPTGCIEWRGWPASPSKRQFAWSALLLPFLEQHNVYQQIDFGRPFDAAENAAVASQRLRVYECPTAPQRAQIRARTDYGGLFGERMVDRAPDDGLFLYDRSLAFRDIPDGLSHTMAVSEDVGGPDSEWINGRNVFVQSGGINDPNAWIGDNEIRSEHPAGATVVFADAQVRFLASSIEHRLLGSLITRANGEIISNNPF